MKTDKKIEYGSPIFKLENIDNCGNEIYIKREDLLPKYFGGNKARIAEAFVSDALAKGCNCVLAYGSASSNMCRVITMICKEKNIHCAVLSSVEDGEEYEDTINSRITKSTGYPFYTCQKSEVPETLEKIVTAFSSQGYNVYYIYDKKNIPTGVSVYCKVFDEIAAENIDFDYIFHASGTGITQAGLICGKALAPNDALCKSADIIGISVSRNEEKEKTILNDYITDFLTACGQGDKVASAASSIHFTDRYTLGGYGKYDSALLAKLAALMYSEGIGLDPIYSGKAFFGMIDYLKDNNISGKKILFINTGSAPLFFDKLPEINSI
ncbi:MAG: pyridoxal-phosphate dependent enzyme [Ruminococcaceae bacterium]|nr:pyridoxal-phosphate dependent enzyme [Oscillospiraceae bacterium]